MVMFMKNSTNRNIINRKAATGISISGKSTTYKKLYMDTHRLTEKSGWGLTKQDHANGINIIKAKLEELCPYYGRINILYGDKQNVQPTFLENFSLDNEDRNEIFDKHCQDQNQNENETENDLDGIGNSIKNNIDDVENSTDNAEKEIAEQKLSIEKEKLEWKKEKVEKENIKDNKQQQNNIIIELIHQNKSLLEIKKMLNFFNNL
ncbi:18040_t:CDS:2 [Dentiscutata erythropus]|uniref:18040_t:CDS:1 n=1 Tax=Dentiscutata erythropus TaxID=1348616 RepID=A0A9N8ZFB1_9GLOM|nr:18040_t:CDS:2 [Dentiscutata erythropus]